LKIVPLAALVCLLNLPLSAAPSPDSKVVLPPAWAFGVLYGGYTDQKDTLSRVKAIQQHAYPIDAYWIDSYADQGRGPDKYIDFEADGVSYPDRAAMWKELHQRGVRGGFWIWDCILQTGNEKAYEDFEKRGYFSSVYKRFDSWHNRSTSTAMFQNGDSKHPGTMCGNIDFKNPQAAYFKQRMKRFFEEGADFVKLDRTSDVDCCRTMFEMSQEFGQNTRGPVRLGQRSMAAQYDEAEGVSVVETPWVAKTQALEFEVFEYP
jgi:alpha-glucosidase (family GH31 glycosyl hydrolase)